MPVAAATPLPSPLPVQLLLQVPFLARRGCSCRRVDHCAFDNSVSGCVSNTTGDVSETRRSPALPIELNGVSVSVDGAAAGLYFVGASEKQINFVVPVAVPSGLGVVL